MDFFSVLTDIAAGTAPVLNFIYIYALDPVLTNLGNLAIAGVALLVGGASVKNARKSTRETHLLMSQQIRGSSLSAARQAWAGDLRDTLAGYLSCCDSLSAMFAQNQTVNSHFLDVMRTASEYESRIFLLLNPENAEQNDLIKAVKVCGVHISNYSPVDKAPVIAAGQALFKSVWADVKSDSAGLPMVIPQGKKQIWYKRFWNDLTE